MTNLPVAPSASVIVVSRGRPDALLRCLAGIEQLAADDFEVVVVSDAPGLDALRRNDLDRRVKSVPFGDPNISTARNHGLRQASGDVVAFIDDDSVPEPTWLSRLIAPFADAGVVAATGFVRGRNGISFQNRARRVDRFGHHTALPMKDTQPRVFPSGPGDAVKTEGTNCAFRRARLLDMGGFDPAFTFFLDETDVNLRLAALSAQTAVVPLAQVHHGFAASAQRRADRMPRTLYDIGASQQVFLRKHAPGSDHKGVLAALRTEQRARLLRHMVAGTCEPRDVGRLMKTLEDGIAEGGIRPFGTPDPLESAKLPFLQFHPRRKFASDIVMAGRIWQKRRLRSDAARAVLQGHRVSLYFFSPTVAYHDVRFVLPGYWEQSGGLWGRSDRKGPLIQGHLFGARLAAEQNRTAPVRQALTH